METIIDIQLVKEQLRLLGHNVADEVILDFVKGLNKPPGAQPTPAASNAAADIPAAAQHDAVSRDAKAAAPQRSPGNKTGANSAAWRPRSDTDAAPSKLQQAPDQQSPKRLPAPAAPGGAVQERHSPQAQPKVALDQRCRNFLARCSETPAQQQLQEQQAQLQQQQQASGQQPLQRPILLQVPQVQDGTAAGAGSKSSNSSSGQRLSSGSSSLLLSEGGELDTDGGDSAGAAHGIVRQQQQRASRQVPSQQLLPKTYDWGLQPQPQQWQRAAPGADHNAPAAAGGAGSSDATESDDDGSYDSDDGSSGCLEAEGSRFLLHQAATMQRVRARLAAKMAGYTAAAAAAAVDAGGAAFTPANSSDSGATAADRRAPAVATATARLGSAPVDSGSSSAGGAGSGSRGSSTGLAERAAEGDSSELPRFGFRPGYKPVGIHMPPPPSTAAVEALAAARALRQQPAAPSAVAGRPDSSSKGASAAQQGFDLPMHMQSLASAVNRLHQQKQKQPAHGRLEPLLLPLASISSSACLLVASPGKTACAGAVTGMRGSSGSIIGGETPPCMTAAAGAKSRHSPKVDPLYLAPSSPRRSNPATPRSSPAISPAPMAPLAATAAGVGPTMHSPASTAAPAAAAAAAAAGAGRSIRQSLSFSASSRAACGRPSAQQQQQQQRQAPGTMRRISSAPATPSSVAPAAAAAVGVVQRELGARASSSAGSYSGGSRRGSVSHESLYCQRLAYSSQRGTVAPGVRKTDRVARFQQMQQQWARDSFLRSGAGGAAAKKSGGQQGHN